jgi:GNAT superfamily N-acetyltransferase
MIEVRRIKPGEGYIIHASAQELGKTHAWGPYMQSTAQDFENALFCANPIVGALVAFVDGSPAGSALWHRSFSTARGKEVMYLEDLVVLPDFRRMGVAEALMKEVAKVAVSLQYPSIYCFTKSWVPRLRMTIVIACLRAMRFWIWRNEPNCFGGRSFTQWGDWPRGWIAVASFVRSQIV